ncbi:hypothetical protein [Streptomyces sp. YS-3]|uniref:hypothetical protein n=1 Tax=Streptomyces sp. YS-3 TaxID=3381352 RepID=UPI003862257F
MLRESHYTAAKTFAKLAEQTLEGVTDQGAKAQTLALIALTHAVLEASYDISSAINEHT